MLIEETLCFQRALSTYAKATEAILHEHVQTLENNEAIPQRLVKAMGYALFGSAKRLRPFLVCESARLFAEITPGAVRVAAAVECAHTYSLVHDDLPAMDDDDMRRGEPTVHKAFDEATAILVGDGLLTEAFALMSAPETHEDPTVRLQLISAFSNALGCGGMVGGQMYDLLAEQRCGAHTCTPESIQQLQRMKTGALFAFSAQAGALLHRQPSHVCQALEAYGYAMGIAFQMWDDVLDEPALESKEDHAEERGAFSSTLRALIGRDSTQKLLESSIANALEHLRSFGDKADLLRDAVSFAVQRQR